MAEGRKWKHISTGERELTWEEFGEICRKEKEEAEAGLRCKGCWDHGYQMSWTEDQGFPVLDKYVPCSVCGRFTCTSDGKDLPK